MVARSGQLTKDADRAVDSAAVTPIRSWLARMRLRSWIFRPFLFLMVGLILLVLCWWLFGLTTSDSFWREAVSAILGAVATIIGATAIAFIALREQLRRVEEKRLLKRFEDLTWKHSSIRVGAMEIPGIAVVASATHDAGWDANTIVEFAPEGSPRATDELTARALDVTLPKLQAQAEERKLTFFDDDCVDIVDVDLTTINRDGKRRPKFTFTPAKARYFDFAVSSSRLDAPVDPEIDPLQPSLRQLWGHGPSSLLEVSALPAVAKLGCGTVAVTKDSRIVFGIRGKTFIASDSVSDSARRSLHFVAEGMIPKDLNQEGRVDPKVGITRGLDEELNIGLSSRNIGRVAEMISTGVFFDQQRWQPCFSYLSRLDITWDEVQTAAPIARDAWEVEALISLPFDIEHAGVRQLLLGTHPDFRLASNHAAAMLWFALLHNHGYHVMRDHLLS